MNQQGAAAETQAAAYLQQNGLKILARNWSCRFGEIDLIAQDGDTLVFVEVRQRASSRFGDAASSITASKQAKLIATAQIYLASQKKRTPACRFDAILLDGDTPPRWLKHIIEA